MPQLKALIFDLDGTLIHSAPDIRFAANKALATLDRGPLDLPTIISFIGNGVEPLVKRALAATGGADAATQQATMQHFLEVYAENMTTRTRPYPGVVQALEQFQRTGLKLGVCTNKLTGPAQEICDQLKLSPFFDVIKGAEPGQPKKPNKHMLLATFQALECAPSDGIYVGDSAIDYNTSRNANVAFRLFTKGYLNDPLPDLKETDQFDDWALHGIALV